GSASWSRARPEGGPRVSRPEVSVVIPFAGGPAQAQAAMRSLRSLDVREGDELILVDNSGGLLDKSTHGAHDRPAVAVIAAPGELSPAHARNVGAARARNQWILFLDADAVPRQGLLDAFF